MTDKNVTNEKALLRRITELETALFENAISRDNPSPQTRIIRKFLGDLAGYWIYLGSGGSEREATLNECAQNLQDLLEGTIPWRK